MGTSSAAEPDRKRVRFGRESSNLTSAELHPNSELKNGALRANQVVQLRFIRSIDDISPDGAAGSHPDHLIAHPTYLHQIIPNEQVLGYSSVTAAIYIHQASLFTWIHTHKTLLNQSSEDDLNPEIEKDPNDDNNQSAQPESTKQNDNNNTESNPMLNTTVTNVEALMAPFIKSGRFTTRGAYLEALETPYTMPLSNRVAKYEKDGRHYGIYKEKFFAPDDNGTPVKRDDFHAFHLRMAFLMFINIDGASFIDDDDPRWEVFVVAEEENDKPMAFIGYATTYPFSALRTTESKSITFAERIRISQVFISPLGQAKGHGSQLLQNIYNDAISRNAVEVTVEDPSLGFRLLRDVTDLRLCYERGLLDPSKPLTMDEESELVEKLRTSLLLTLGQAKRCLEVHQLRHTDKDNEDSYKKYRLWVKRRLFKENLEVLDQYDTEERKKKLAEIFEDYEKEYTEAIKRINARLERMS